MNERLEALSSIITIYTHESNTNQPLRCDVVSTVTQEREVKEKESYTDPLIVRVFQSLIVSAPSSNL